MCTFSIGVSVSRNKPSGAALYPNLPADYSVINMPTSEDNCLDMQKLLPIAEQMTKAVQSNISSLESMIRKSQKGKDLMQ